VAWLLSKRPEAVLYDKVGRGSVSHLCRSSVAPFLGDACDGWGADSLRRIATKRRHEEFARKDLSEIRQYRRMRPTTSLGGWRRSGTSHPLGLWL